MADRAAYIWKSFGKRQSAHPPALLALLPLTPHASYGSKGGKAAMSGVRALWGLNSLAHYPRRALTNTLCLTVPSGCSQVEVALPLRRLPVRDDLAGGE